MTTAIRKIYSSAINCGVLLPRSVAAETSAAGPADSSALHLHLMWSCIAVGVVVFGTIFYSVIEFRRSHGVLKAPWHATTVGEMLWTAIPFLMLVALVTPATRALIALHDSQKAPLTVEITAPPVEWRFAPPGGGAKPVAVPLAKIPGAAAGPAEVVLPSRRRIRLRLAPGTSKSTWSIPEVGFHSESTTASASEAWLYLPKSGDYKAECSGACAPSRGTPLRLRVRAVPQGVYNVWLESAVSAAGPEPGAPSADAAR
jgi:cytochrome c oxidase subunit 2